MKAQDKAMLDLAAGILATKIVEAIVEIEDAVKAAKKEQRKARKAKAAKKARKEARKAERTYYRPSTSPRIDREFKARVGADPLASSRFTAVVENAEAMVALSNEIDAMEKRHGIK